MFTVSQSTLTHSPASYLKKRSKEIKSTFDINIELPSINLIQSHCHSPFGARRLVCKFYTMPYLVNFFSPSNKNTKNEFAMVYILVCEHMCAKYGEERKKPRGE